MASIVLCLAVPAGAEGFASEADWAASVAAVSGASAELPPVPAPGPSSELDALGRPVSLETRAAYERILAASPGRRFSARDQDFLLAVLNSPALPSGPFRSREALVRHFAGAGVRIGDSAKTGLADSDLWRLIRAARAAAQAYRIPAPILLCLTFRESGFQRGAMAWTTSAKGVAQMTNPAAQETIAQIRRNPELRAATEEYARLLGARMPERVEGAPDVDEMNTRMRRAKAAGAPPEELRRLEAERRRLIAGHKDEPGHIFNVETNFGLGAAYLAYLRRKRLGEVPDELLGWLTAVAAYNQGIGTANELIYKVYGGPADYASRGVDEIFSQETAARLTLSPERRHEMLGEVGSVRGCAVP